MAWRISISVTDCILKLIFLEIIGDRIVNIWGSTTLHRLLKSFMPCVNHYQGILLRHEYYDIVWILQYIGNTYDSIQRRRAVFESHVKELPIQKCVEK